MGFEMQNQILIERQIEAIITYLLIGIIIAICILIAKKIKQQKINEQKINRIEKTENQQITNEIKNNVYMYDTYTQRWLFTQNEKTAYYKIKEIADKHQLTVFSKVRLLDLVEPRQHHPKYKTNLYKIQAKHVDFVLANNKLVAEYVIELDDNSHDRPDRKERDEFVDKVLTACGYKVLHTRYINEEQLEKFINSNKEPKTEITKENEQ